MTLQALQILAHLRGKDTANHKDELYFAEGSVKDEALRDELAVAIGALVMAEASLKRVERLAHLAGLKDEQKSHLIDSLENSIRLVSSRKACETVGRTQ